MKDIDKLLRRLRKVHGKTLAELSALTGLSISFLSDIERGKTEPSLTTLSKIAEAYGMVFCITFYWKEQTKDDPTDTTGKR